MSVTEGTIFFPFGGKRYECADSSQRDGIPEVGEYDEEHGYEKNGGHKICFIK